LSSQLTSGRHPWDDIVFAPDDKNILEIW